MAVQKEYEIGYNYVYLKFYNFGSADYNRYVTFYYSGDNVNWHAYGSPQILRANDPAPYVECTYSGLQPDSYYYFKGVFTGKSSTYTYGPYYWKTEPLPIIYDHETSLTCIVTATTISAYVYLDSAVDYIVDLTLLLDGERDLECDISVGSTFRSRMWLTDIIPGTQYEVALRDNLKGTETIRYVRTKNDFSWTTDNGTGEFKSGDDFKLLATDWNTFTSQLKAKERYYTGTNRTFTTAVTGNDFTSEMFNQAVNAINNLVANDAPGCTSTMDTVTKGSPVKAADINQLAVCLNE